MKNRKRKHEFEFGHKFSRLTFISEDSVVKEGKTLRRFHLICECGTYVSTCPAQSVISGGTVSCGCSKRENAAKNIKILQEKSDKRLSCLSGRVFSHLTIMNVVDETLGTGVIKYNCICDCGNTKQIRAKDIVSGQAASCGCNGLNDKGIRNRELHGKSKERIYKIWQLVLARCYMPSTRYYRYYGARGIIVADEWHSFQKFYDDMQPTYRDELSLDRIDVFGNYSKDNCRWADDSMQAFNQRKRSTNTSGKTGVKFDKKSNKWKAEITKNYKVLNLGFYENFWDALCARVKAELFYYGFTKN